MLAFCPFVYPFYDVPTLQTLNLLFCVVLAWAPLWVTFKGQSVTATSNVCFKWVSYPFAEEVGFQPYSRVHAWFPLKKMLSLFLLFCPSPWEFPNIDRLRANSNSTSHVTNNSDIKSQGYTGGEPVTFSTTQAQSRSSNQLNCELLHYCVTLKKKVYLLKTV